MTSAADLHDASLEAVRFDWKTRACLFDFQGSPRTPEPFRLTFVEVSALQIPASFPWGPSVSVLELRADGSGRFEFEMQSGDDTYCRIGQQFVRDWADCSMNPGASEH